MHPFDSDNSTPQDEPRMFEATENSDVNSFTGDAFNPGLDSGNDAQAIERRINELSGQLADLTRQLEALKTGAPAASNLDPFSGDAPVHGVDADPFSSPDCATTADRPGREELSEVFSKIKSSFHNDDEELLDESLATTCDSTSGDSEADEELVEPEVSVSMSPATPREPESVAEILARMKASGQLESDLDLVPASDSSSNPGPDDTVAALASAQPRASNLPTRQRKLLQHPRCLRTMCRAI